MGTGGRRGDGGEGARRREEDEEEEELQTAGELWTDLDFLILEVAPSLYMVELRKSRGDTLEFHKAFVNTIVNGLPLTYPTQDKMSDARSIWISVVCAGMLKPDMVKYWVDFLCCQAENMSKRWRVEVDHDVKEKSIIKELSKNLGARSCVNYDEWTLIVRLL
ncbi:hypothetical protein Droror1_Dr00006420 [Drosera rotundifolia]